MALFWIFGTWEDSTHVSTKHQLLQMSLCPHHVHPAVGSVLFLKAHLFEVGADFTYIWGSGGIYTADTIYFQVKFFFVFFFFLWFESSQSRDQTCVPCLGRWILTTGSPAQSQVRHSCCYFCNLGPFFFFPCSEKEFWFPPAQWEPSDMCSLRNLVTIEGHAPILQTG